MPLRSGPRKGREGKGREGKGSLPSECISSMHLNTDSTASTRQLDLFTIRICLVVNAGTRYVVRRPWGHDLSNYRTTTYDFNNDGVPLPNGAQPAALLKNTPEYMEMYPDLYPCGNLYHFVNGVPKKLNEDTSAPGHQGLVFLLDQGTNSYDSLTHSLPVGRSVGGGHITTAALTRVD
eukprot:GHVU01077927.1.p1 GENE.GHVU01077927.1~~GHVU01077927.1.p1  ORF type:complete len:178 (-),score=3.91 GHVU01077927.1:222-755(-)